MWWRRTERGDSKSRSLRLADDQNTILGYSVKYEGKLQWVYVKQDFRGLGIEKMLEHLQASF